MTTATLDRGLVERLRFLRLVTGQVLYRGVAAERDAHRIVLAGFERDQLVPPAKFAAVSIEHMIAKPE